MTRKQAINRVKTAMAAILIDCTLSGSAFMMNVHLSTVRAWRDGVSIPNQFNLQVLMLAALEQAHNTPLWMDRIAALRRTRIPRSNKARTTQ